MILDNEDVLKQRTEIRTRSFFPGRHPVLALCVSQLKTSNF